MKVRKQLIAVLAVVLVLAAILAGQLYRKTDLSLPNFLRPYSQTKVLMSMQGFRFMQFEQDETPWRMEARSADLYENKEAKMRDVEIVFSGAESRVVTLLGEEGTMNTTTGDAVIYRGERDVRVVTSDGYLLTTPSLSWSSRERNVRTSDPFKLLGSTIYLEGRGFSGNTDLHMLKVNDRVKAVLHE